MITNRFLPWFRTCLVVLALTGLCTGCITTMTGMAPSTTPITANDTYQVTGGKTTGINRSFMITVFIINIPIFPVNPSEDSLQNALRQTNGDALIEVAQDNTQIFIPLLVVPVTFYMYTTRTVGTPVKITRGGALASGMEPPGSRSPGPSLALAGNLDGPGSLMAEGGPQ